MTSTISHYKSLSNDEILNIFQESIIKNVKNEYKEKVMNGKPLKSSYLDPEMDPEPYTQRTIEPIIRDFLPNIDFQAEIHTKTSLGTLKKPDWYIKSKDLHINKNLLIEWEPYNENLWKRDEHGIAQAKKWLSDINIGSFNDALVTNGVEWVHITPVPIDDEIRIIENRLDIKDALELMEKIYKVEEISKPKLKNGMEITTKFYNWYASLIYGGEFLDRDNSKKKIPQKLCLLENIENALNERDKLDFIRITITRLIFIRILQEYGIIDFDVLNYLKKTKPEDFYHRVQQIFFESLNTTPDHRENLPDILKDLPYLNGEIFRRNEIDEKSLKIKRERFLTLIDFINAFSFKKEEIKDIEDICVDNTIDPQILGHILENTIEDRKKSGVYYTPKKITDFMAEDIIKTCILNKTIKFLKDKNDDRWKYLEVFNDIYKLDKIIVRKIYQFIRNLKICDPAVGSGAFLLNCGEILYNIRKRIMDILNIKDTDYSIKREIIQNNLYGVDIKDIACHICKLRLWLWIIQKYEPEPLPNIDFNIRSGNSLIGYNNLQSIKVDLEDIGSWISKGELLDLFLDRSKLITKYYKEIDPLLQRKKKRNIEKRTIEFKEKLNLALLDELNKEKVSIKEKIQENFERLSEIKNHLILIKLNFKNALRIDKTILKEMKIESNQIEITGISYNKANSIKFNEDFIKTHNLQEILKIFDLIVDRDKPKEIEYERHIMIKEIEEFNVFHWIMEFSDVFEYNGGFDIFIGNPPYFRVTNAPKKEQRVLGTLGLLKNYHHGQGDIYYDFIVRSFELMNNTGYFSFITSRYWLESTYAKYLKKFLKEKVKILKIIDFQEYSIFEDANINNSILVYTKNIQNDDKDKFQVYLYNEEASRDNKVQSIEMLLNRAGIFDLNNWNANENWAFVPSQYRELFIKIKKIKTSLGQDYKCNQYSNCFRKHLKSKLIFEKKPEEISNTYLRKYRKMLDIEKFSVKSDIENYVLVINNKNEAWKDDQLAQFLKKNKIKKKDIYEIKVNSDKNIDKYDEVIYIGYRIPRIIFNFIYNNENIRVDNTYFITKRKPIAFSLKYVTAVLNSKLMRYYIDIIGKKKDIEIEIGSNFIENLPLILRRGNLTKGDLKLIEQIEDLVSEIIRNEKIGKNIDNLINSLNRLVYKLYKINKQEEILINSYLQDTKNKLFA